MMEDENKHEIYCFIVPRLILDLTANTDEEELIDFRNITIGWGRNFYEEIINDTWKGFDDLRKHPLYQVADEEGLWQADDWSDPEYEKRQFMIIDNLANLYRPDGTIAWPREDPKVDWADDFYFGHSSITQDATINRMNFEKAQQEAASARANALDKDDEDEDEDGLSQFEQHSLFEDDLGDRNADPWKAWVEREHGTTDDPKQCPACKVTYSTIIRPERLICGTCYSTEYKTFQEALDDVDDELDGEGSKRQKLGAEVALGDEDEDDEDDEDYNMDDVGGYEDLDDEEDVDEEDEDEDDQDEDDFIQHEDEAGEKEAGEEEAGEEDDEYRLGMMGPEGETDSDEE
jgi:protein-arginine kinase activator protein McsA